MKKTFTVLIAAIAAILMMAQPVKAVGQSKDATVIASWSRSNSTNNASGGSFTTSNLGNSGTNWVGEKSAGVGYLQIKNNSAYWTTTPSSITLTATIGAGQAGSISTYIVAVLLDSNGDPISSTATNITNNITTAGGDVYSNISIPCANNVYGIRLYHTKYTGINVRYFSFSLSYEAGSSATYDVIYKANDGSSTADITDTYYSGDPVTLRGGNTFTFSGHTFFSWNTAADGSGTNKEAGTSLTNSIASDYTFYARWNYNVAIGTVTGTTITATYNETNLTGNTNAVPRGAQITLAHGELGTNQIFNWSILKSSDNSNVTASVLSGTTLTMPDYDIIIGGSVQTVDPSFTIDFKANGNCSSTSATFDHTNNGLPTGTSIAMTTAQNGSQNAPAYNGNNHQLRLYYGQNGNGNGCSVTLSPTGMTITKVVINSATTPNVSYRTKSNGTWSSSWTSCSWSGSTITVGNLSVGEAIEFKNVNTAASTQLQITSIEISYQVNEVFTPTVTLNNNSYGTLAGPTEDVYTVTPNEGCKIVDFTKTNDVTVEQLTGDAFSASTYRIIATAANQTVTFSLAQRTGTTVTLHDGLNGSTTTNVDTYKDATLADVIAGHSIASVNGWTALGWVKSYTSGDPTLITTTEAVGETTDLYAVYKKGSNTFQRITADSGLEVNATYMICYNSGTTYKFINGEDSNNSGHMAYTDANTVSENSFEYVSGEKFVLGGSAGAYTFIDGTKYLTGSEEAQGLSLSTTLDDYGKWMITMNTYAQIENKGNYNGGTNSYANRYVSYHTKNNYFNCYTSYSSIYLFKQITNDLQYSIAPTAEKCSLTYNANGGDGGDVIDNNNGAGYDAGTQVTVKANDGESGNPGFSKKGHTFFCWSDMEDGNDNNATLYEAGDHIVLNANTTLYAQWTVNSYNWSTDLTNAVSGTTAQLKVNNAAVAANAQIAYGTEVTVEVTVPNGYIYNISVNNGAVSVNNNKFTMPDENVAVVVTTELNPYEIHTLSSDNMKNTKDENGNAIINSGGTNTSGYGVLKFITTSDGVWISNGYQNTASGVVSLGMLQLRDRGHNDGVSYIQLPVFNGKIETITMTVTSGGGTASNAGGCKALLNFQTGNTSSETVITSGGDKDNGTGSITLDLTSGFYSTGYITASSATARIWNIDVKIRPYQDMTGTEFTIAADRMVSIPASTNATAENLTIPANSGVIIKSGASLTVSGTLTNSGTAANLIVKDGGRLIVYNEGVQATVEKEVVGVGATNWAATSGAQGWYFIASPVDGASFSTATGVSEDYDLYMLDWNTNAENSYWLNQKNDDHIALFANGFQRGTGYLYASEAGNILSVAGEIQPLSSEDKATVTLAATGWNLIGNPLTCKVTVDHDFGMLNNGSTVDYTGTTVNPFQGIVVWGNANDVVTFTKAATQNAAAPSNNSSLQMTLSQNIVTRGNTTSTTVDNAVVSFGEGEGLPKFNMLESNANLYIPQGNEEYAIVSTNAQGEMPVNFVANEEGAYTITVNPENVEMNYLHLKDNITGTDVDLLTNPSYTFTANADDYPSRFRLVFSAINNQNDNENESFAFIGSDGQLIVNGIGTVQIIDLTGRVISTKSTEERISTNGMTPGVYVLRLIGEKVKTQKIVVR